MLTTALLTIGSILVTLSVIPYLKDIIGGNAKPRFVSWLIWAVLLGLMAAVSWREGQMGSAVLATASALGCGSVTILAVRRISLRMTRMECFTLIGAAIGIALWLVFDDPMLVLLAAVTVDGIAFLPTYINGWRNPQHESLTMFAISAAGSLLVLISAMMEQANSLGLIYPVYSVIFTGIMVGILAIRRLKQYEEVTSYFPRNEMERTGSH